MRSDGQQYLRCEECGEYVNSSEAEAHTCAAPEGSEGRDAHEADRIRELAVLILGDDNGISGEAWTALRPMLIESGLEEIVRRVEATDRRFYLPDRTQEDA